MRLSGMKRLLNMYVAGLGLQVAGKSGLNRMELGGEPDELDERRSRIGWDEGEIEESLL